MLRTLPLILGAGLAGLAALPAATRAESRPAGDPAPSGATFRVDINPKSVYSSVRAVSARQVRSVGLQFQIHRNADGKVDVSVRPEEVRVLEDNKEVLNLRVVAPSQKLSLVLALDISGSMARGRKMEDAKKAALGFLDRLGPDAEVGLVLFDHLIRTAEAPARGDAAALAAHKEKLRRLIREAQPQGGTAYLDATVKATQLLKGATGRRVAVVMTDGVDMNSSATLKTAVDAALKEQVTVYTVGIGEKGKNDPVTTVLVLDRSGSMLEKADDKDKGTKIVALRLAASRFVELMRPTATTTVLSFSSELDPAEPFTGNKLTLKKRIHSLIPEGSTRLYDATFAGIETLVAGGSKGKRAVVALTDGKDEGSPAIHDDDEVIARAKEAKVPLYMLGLGRPGEINEPVMQKMAKETGGDYFHAGSQERLLEIFEKLSIELHDDGVDERTLLELAEKTGGKYTHVSELSQLQIFYSKLADELESTYQVTYDSPRPAQDGLARDIKVDVYREGRKASSGGQADDVARGVIVPQMSYAVYLLFLAALGGLLVVPGMLRRPGRPAV